MRITIPIYYDVWMDNGVVNLYRMLCSIEKQQSGILQTNVGADELEVEVFNHGRLKELLEDAIKISRDNYIFYWDEDNKTKIKVNKKKAFVVIHYASKDRFTKRNVLQEDIFRDGKISEILEGFFKELESKRNNKVCTLCGRRYSISVRAAYPKQAVYPLVTKIKSLSGVRTKVLPNGNVSGMADYYKHLCPYCYLVGTLEWADPTIIYRSFVRGRKVREGFSVVLLPSEPNLAKLKEVKESSQQQVEPLAQNKVSNIRVKIRGREGEQERPPIAKFTLLLGFLENFLREYAAKKEVLDYYNCRRKISENWVALEIPEGQVKDVKVYPLIVENDFLRLLVTLIESEHCPYYDFLGSLWLRNSEGKPADSAIQDEVKEELACSLITDNFDSFAGNFTPRRRASLVIYPSAKETLEQIIKEWRWYKMGLKEEDLEIVRKAARVVAKAGENSPSILYKLQRARGLTELLDALTQVSHKIIGMEAKELQYLSMDSVERLVEMLHSKGDDPHAFKDLRNTLVIFASVEWGKGIFKGGKVDD